jgi:hypothetical protein
LRHLDRVAQPVDGLGPRIPDRDPVDQGVIGEGPGVESTDPAYAENTDMHAAAPLIP